MKHETDAHLVPVDSARVHEITRPDPVLWTLYIIYSLLSNVALPFVILPLYFRFKTLRYRFDDHGVSVSYGLIWRRETYLTYARIQDIHVTRNIFERWLGIGTVQIQTASGSAAATESIVGLKAFQEVRNYLYAHMRGHRREQSGVMASGAAREAIGAGSAQGGQARLGHASADDALAVDALAGIRDELRAVRVLLETRQLESVEPDARGATARDANARPANAMQPDSRDV